MCQGSLLKAWKLISRLYLVECPQLSDSAQCFVFLSAHFLTFIRFLSIATCFDPVTVCELFVPIFTRLPLVSACLYLFTSRFFILHCFPLASRFVRYESFLVVSSHLPDVSTRSPVVSHFNTYARTTGNFQRKYMFF